jgi:capsular polysaccharide biosynthesis protein
MQVELRSNSEILRIAVEHDRADVAFFLANAVTEAYLIETTRESEEAQAKRLAVLEQLHASTEERLSNAWVEFRQLARQLGSGDLGALSLQAQAEIENYRDANRRLREVRAEKREIEREVRLIRESPELVTAEIPDEGTSSIRYALFQAKLRKEHALSKWGPNHPEVRAAQQNEDLFLEFYQKALLKDEEQQEQRPKKTREEEVLAEPLAALARITAEEQALETMIEEIDQRVQLLGGDSIPRLEVIRNGINRMERLSDRIWNTREDSSVERHADNRVQLVAYASLPSQPDTSKRKKISLALAAGGFGFAFVLLAMGEFLTGRLHSAREATQRTGLTVLASLPRLPVEVRNSPEVRTLHVRSNPLNTQMDMLVAQLRHNPNAPDPRTILVTCSRWPREREHVAVHLAAALARTGQRTVFVNFNLRSQPAHVVFPNAIAEIATTPTDQVTGDASSSGDDDVCCRRPQRSKQHSQQQGDPLVSPRTSDQGRRIGRLEAEFGLGRCCIHGKSREDGVRGTHGAPILQFYPTLRFVPSPGSGDPVGRPGFGDAFFRLRLPRRCTNPWSAAPTGDAPPRLARSARSIPHRDGGIARSGDDSTRQFRATNVGDSANLSIGTRHQTESVEGNTSPSQKTADEPRPEPRSIGTSASAPTRRIVPPKPGQTHPEPLAHRRRAAPVWR